VIAARGTITDVKTLADRVREARKSKGWTQAELAKEAGVGQSAIGNIEAGKRSNPQTLTAIGAALGRRPKWLLRGEPPEFEDDDSGQTMGKEPRPKSPKPSVAAALAMLEPLFAPLSVDARKSVAILIEGWIFNPRNNNAELIEALVSASATNKRVEQTFGQPLAVHEPKPPVITPKKGVKEKK